MENIRWSTFPTISVFRLYPRRAGSLHGCPAFLWPRTIAHFPVRPLTGHNILKHFLLGENNSALLLEKFFTNLLLGGFEVSNKCLMTILLHLLVAL